MASLLALLSQQTPSLQTRKGLILLGLQNDFLSPDGKLPVSTKSGFVDRVKELVPSFREFGDIIWVRSEFEANREANVADENGDTVIAGSYETLSEQKDIKHGSKRSAANDSTGPMKRMKAADIEEDPELFLRRTETREPACLRGSWGAEYHSDLQAVMDEKDLQVTKTYYSAFGSTSLLLTLRSRLITELFVCGCNTNLSVFATAMDAARYGISITLIKDCLGFRKKDRHDEAIRQLVEIMGADVTSSDKVVDMLKNPSAYEYEDEEDGEDDEDSDASCEAAEVKETHQQAPGAVEPRAHASEENAEALLAADSNDEDEYDMPLPITVRSSRFLQHGLSLRYSSMLSSRSRTLAAHTKPAHPAERAQPSQPPATDVGGAVTTEEHEARSGPRAKDVRADRAEGVEPEVEDLSSDSGSVAIPSEALHSQFRDASPSEKRATDVSPSEGQHSLSWLGLDSLTSRDSQTLPPHSSHPGLNAFAAVAGLDQTTVNEYEHTMALERSTDRKAQEGAQKSQPLFGEDKQQESAGSRILYGLLPSELADSIFDELKAEIDWQRMHHQTGEVPRLVCCQGDVAEDGTMPVYRHPSDQTLPLRRWSPTVEKVRKAAEEAVGHPLNHALIQLYRGGSDYISEHSDKTLDIVKGSNIVNVSFGARRTMRLRTKRGALPSTAPVADGSAGPPAQRTTYRVPMPHNSMITMSLETNAEYLHGINADKRPAVEFIEAEKAYGGQRISLTFRHIGTFLTADKKMIWGQGAVGKTKEEVRAVVHGNAVESQRLVRAFGAENQSSSIDWDAVYGEGSDVLHLK